MMDLLYGQILVIKPKVISGLQYVSKSSENFMHTRIVCYEAQNSQNWSLNAYLLAMGGDMFSNKALQKKQTTLAKSHANKR